MSDSTQLQLETKEVALLLQGEARLMWSGIGTWLAITATLTIASVGMGAFLQPDTVLSYETHLAIMFAIGIVICLTSLLAAHMVARHVSKRLYGQQLTKRLGEDFLDVKLQEANPDGSDASKNVMRFNARTASGDQVKITALLSSEQVFGNGTTCTYRLVITPA